MEGASAALEALSSTAEGAVALAVLTPSRAGAIVGGVRRRDGGGDGGIASRRRRRGDGGGGGGVAVVEVVCRRRRGWRGRVVDRSRPGQHQPGLEPTSLTSYVQANLPSQAVGVVDQLVDRSLRNQRAPVRYRTEGGGKLARGTGIEAPLLQFSFCSLLPPASLLPPREAALRGERGRAKIPTPLPV